MEEFKEYWERLFEWFKIFIQSRWIKTLLLVSILIGFVVATVYSIIGAIVHPNWTNPIGGQINVFGHQDWAIPAAIFSIFGFIWTLFILKNAPNKSKLPNLGKFYRPWKLWYWMPSILTLTLVEFLIRLFIILLYGKYIDNSKKAKQKKVNPYSWSSIYKTWKLWYWIPTLGLAILFEYFIAWTIRVQNSKYYPDLILLLVLILLFSLILGIFAYDARTTTIRILQR